MVEKFEGFKTDIALDEVEASDSLNLKHFKDGSAIGPLEGCDVQVSLTNTDGALAQIWAVTTPGTATVGITIAVVGLTNNIEGLGQFVPASRASLTA